MERWNQLSMLLRKIVLFFTLSETGAGCWQVCSSVLLRLPAASSVLLRQITWSGPHVRPSSVERRSAMSVQPPLPSAAEPDDSA